MQPGAARRRRCIRLCRILFMSEGAIIHGYLLFPDTGSAGRLLYISRTLGKGSRSLPAFRFRKAGIPKFSAGKTFLPDGPAPIRYESLPCGNPGTASFPEPEQRQGQHAFPQRPEDTVIFRLHHKKTGFHVILPDTAWFLYPLPRQTCCLPG